jgi:nicotinamidase/pyrazinamidase
MESVNSLNIKNMKALIVVDAQYDFMPATEEEYAKRMGGALAVTEGDKIIPIINDLLSQFELVIFTKDWHTEDMDAFASSHPGKQPFDKYKPLIQPEDGEKWDTLWPAHCVANTRGADIHDDIDFGLINGDFYIFKKGLEKDYHPYSGFGGTDLAEFLRHKNVTQVFICGLALDYCVKDTAIDAVKEGFEVVVVENATRSIRPDINDLLQTFLDLNIKMIDSWELPLFNLM